MKLYKRIVIVLLNVVVLIAAAWLWVYVHQSADGGVVVDRAEQHQQQGVMRTYVNTAYHYQISYNEADYAINPFDGPEAISSDAKTVLFFAQQMVLSAEPLAALAITGKPNPNRLSARQFFANTMRESVYTGPTDIVFAGQPAISYGTERERYVLVTKGDVALVIQNGDPDLLQNFQFTE